MKIIYIAGAFCGPTHWDIVQNVRRAESAGLVVASLGAMLLIPYKNTENFHGQLDDHFWLEGTLEMMRRCDAVFVFDVLDIGRSSGTRSEIREALRRNTPVFVRSDDLGNWLASGDLSRAVTVDAFRTACLQYDTGGQGH